MLGLELYVGQMECAPMHFPEHTLRTDIEIALSGSSLIFSSDQQKPTLPGKTNALNCQLLGLNLSTSAIWVSM